MTLTITHEAAEAIDQVVHSEPDAPDTAGLRIARATTPDGEQGLQLSVTSGPAVGDDVLDAEGTPVFLEAEAALLLDDKVLDSDSRTEGIGFLLREQGGEPAA